MVETEREQVSGAAAQSWSLLLTPRPMDIKKKKKFSSSNSLTPISGSFRTTSGNSLWLHPSIPFRSLLRPKLSSQKLQHKWQPAT